MTLLDRSVVADPRAVAVVADLPDSEFGRLELSYGDLDARVNRLARHLISLGVGPEARVALALRRSVDLVVAMYAVAKAGGAYVPIDPDQPVERIRYVLEAADPICVLTTSELAATAADFDELDEDETVAPAAAEDRGHTLDWRGRRHSIPARTEPARARSSARRPTGIFTDIAVPLVRLDEVELSRYSADTIVDVERTGPLR
ncbi:AMP-binding protein, partial [Nocardia gipuzkoensis]